jgi:hypothetical protein
MVLPVGRVAIAVHLGYVDECVVSAMPLRGSQKPRESKFPVTIHTSPGSVAACTSNHTVVSALPVSDDVTPFPLEKSFRMSSRLEALDNCLRLLPGEAPLAGDLPTLLSLSPEPADARLPPLPVCATGWVGIVQPGQRKKYGNIHGKSVFQALDRRFQPVRFNSAEIRCLAQRNGSIDAVIQLEQAKYCTFLHAVAEERPPTSIPPRIPFFSPFDRLSFFLSFVCPKFFASGEPAALASGRSQQ